MNREAAALGVPVYSIFGGKVGAVDRRLEEEGRLVMLTSPAEIRNKVQFVRRDKAPNSDSGGDSVLNEVIDHIEKIGSEIDSVKVMERRLESAR